MASSNEIMDEIADGLEYDFQSRICGAALNFARDHGPIAAAMDGDENSRLLVGNQLKKFIKQSRLKIVNLDSREQACE